MVDLGFFVRDGPKKWYYLSRRLDMHTILGLAIIIAICGGGAISIVLLAQILAGGHGKTDSVERSRNA